MYKIFATTVFGITVIGSGLFRYFFEKDGETGLWFGVVIGGIGLVAAILFFLKKATTARILATICACIAGGWFIYEAWIKKQFDVGPRMHIVIFVSFVELVVLYAGFGMGSADTEPKESSADG